MANRDQNQRQDDYEGFISVPQLQNDNPQEALPANDSGTGGPNPFTFTPLQSSPLPARNLYGYQGNLPRASVNDLNIGTNVDENPMNIPINQNIIVIDDNPILDNQGFSFPSVGMVSMSSGYHIPNNVMTSYHGMSRVPQFEYVGIIDRNSINAVNRGVGNFHLDAETQNSIRQPTGHYRNVTNFSESAAQVNQITVPRVYDNQVRANMSQPNRLDRLDGRFLSLGNVASYVNSNTYGERAIHMSETPLSSQGQSPYNSFNNVRGLAGFQNNADGLVTTWDSSGNQNISGGGSSQLMNSRHDMNPTSNLYGGPVTMHHYIPTPSGRTSEAGNESGSSMYSSDPSDCSRADQRVLTNNSSHNQGLAKNVKRRMQGVPFNSTILRSNHQIATDPPQNAYLTTNLIPPSSGIGESDSHDKSGLALGSCATSSAVQPIGDDLVPRSSRFLSAGMPARQFSSGLLPAGKNYPPYTGHGLHSTGQTADFTVKNEHHQASTAVTRDSLKRNLNFPPRA
ncbi:uncharacterized protein LOC110692162 [Chenopodium quinoa]|uniref:Uncharacterized protein n=1 Tax=Chenopodium quinoa TaxID=63459 RepID=A0A803MS29_CHEQI|nr:uncharacterized protein LOC110692162 [Chenopodium quinoa]